MGNGNESKTTLFALGVLFTSLVFAIIFYGGISWLRNYVRAQSGDNNSEESSPSKPISPTSSSSTESVEGKEGIGKLPQGGIVDIKGKKIEIPAIIANPNMPLELLACAEGGKDYESLVVLKCKPQEIQLPLILFGLKEGKSPRSFGDPTKPTGDFVLVFVEWEKDKKTYSYRAEDLIIDMRTKKSWPRVGWVYTGSTFEDEIDYDTGKPTGRKIYQANLTKTIIATYHDPTAILDNPTESGGIGNIYQPNKELLPEIGTPAKVIIRVPNKKELEELKKVNEEVAKWEAEWKKKMEEEMKKEQEKQPPKEQPEKESPPEKE